jgi:hypothetical protein
MEIKIEKGKHYASGIHVRPYLGKRFISWKINLDISCLYTPINDDSNDLNKLCGISFGHHHKKSLRFAWRPDFNIPGQFMIYAYWYSNGQRRSLYIGNISHNLDYEFQIIIDESIVAFAIYHPRISQYPLYCTDINYPEPKVRIGYYLWPYFGGNNTAPHDMKLDFKIE